MQSRDPAALCQSPYRRLKIKKPPGPQDTGGRSHI
nr:MAG TPA: hypothetical protein [Caudoviricetes sp.]